MTVLVAGATGATGRRVVEELVQAGVPVRALVRDADRARALLPAGVELAVADVGDRPALERALQGCDRVICATGARPSLDVTGPLRVDYLGVRNLVDAARAAGVSRFVLVSSLCVSRLLHPLNLFWLVLFWKRLGENYLRTSGLDWTIVRPGGLTEEEATPDLTLVGADQLERGRLPRRQVARVCVAALDCSAASRKVVEIVAADQPHGQGFAEQFAAIATP